MDWWNIALAVWLAGFVLAVIVMLRSMRHEPTAHGQGILGLFLLLTPLWPIVLISIVVGRFIEWFREIRAGRK